MRASVSRLLSLAPGLLALAITPVAQTGYAQAYPARPVRLVAPFPAGAGIDAAARVLAQKLTDVWGQPVIVDNRPGASANIGAEIVARSLPDGHTLLLTNNALAISAALNPGLSNRALRDLYSVTQVLRSYYVLIVPASFQAKSVGELISLAKARPGELAYGSAGVGSGPHLAAVLFGSVAGVSLHHVPYKGGGPMLPDLIAGRIQIFFTPSTTIMPHVRAGRLRALGVTAPKSLPALPGIPAIAEAGVPGYEVTTWFLLLVAAKTPDAIVGKIHNDVVAVLRQPEVIKALGGEGSELVGSTPVEAAALLEREVTLWTTVIRDAGLKPTD